MNMQKWQSSNNYMGADMSDHYIVVSQNRDSDILTQSNFNVAVKMLADTDAIVHSFNHWACGWLEHLMIPVISDHLATCEDIVNAIADYPILDEDNYNNLQHEAIVEYWQNIDSSERVELLHKAGEDGRRWVANYPPDNTWDIISDFIF